MSNKPNEQEDLLPAAAGRNTANDALEESNRFFTTLAQVSPVGIYRTDAQGGCVYANERWCKIAGMTAVKALGGGWVQAIHPDDRDEVAKTWYTSAQARQNFIMEYRFQRPNGETRWVQGEAAAERNAAGIVVGYVGTVTDITQSKKVEENLRKSEVRYRSLFKNMLDGFAYCRMQYDDRNQPVDFIYLDVNEAFGRLTGLKNVVGKPVSEVIPGIREQNPELFEIYGRVASTGNPELFDLDLRLLGKWLTISVYSPERGYFVAVFDDITERKKSEERLKQSEEKLRAYMGNISDVIWLIDTGLNIAYVSPSVTHMLGVLPEELIGRPSALVIHPDDMETVVNAQRYVMGHPGIPHTIQYRVSHKYGCWIHVESTGVNMLDNPVINGVLVAMRDVTGRKLAENALRASENRYRLLVESSPFCIHEIDVEGCLLSMNRAGLDMFSLEDAMEIRGVPYLGTVSTQDVERVGALLQDAVTNGTSSHFEFAASGDAPLYFKSCFIPIKDAGGKVSKLMGITEDITERKRAEEQIYDLAFHDSLTRLPNRRLLNDRLEQAMAASKRSGLYGALMILDMDNFKPLNDEHGHYVGDLLLVEVAHRISSCVREMDTVARFGGDEFMVMLGELDMDTAESARQAGMVAEKIRNALAKPYALNIRREGNAEMTIEHHCTSSIGVVLFTSHENSAEDIIKYADIAMYQAKESGGNLIRFYE